jgi:putative ABC transport system permease protein
MAMLLTAVGIYGIVSFSVNRRSREFGIRVALGAERTRVLRLVFGQALRLWAVGIIVGIAGALALNRTLSSLLSGIVSLDPLILLGACVLLMIVAILATSIPARRASKVDPVVALRYE